MIGRRVADQIGRMPFCTIEAHIRPLLHALKLPLRLSPFLAAESFVRVFPCGQDLYGNEHGSTRQTLEELLCIGKKPESKAGRVLVYSGGVFAGVLAGSPSSPSKDGPTDGA